MTTSNRPQRLGNTTAVGSLSRESFIRVFAGRTITSQESTSNLFGNLSADAPFTAPRNIRSAFRVNPEVLVITDILGVVPTVVVGTPPEPTDPEPPDSPEVPGDTYVLLLLDEDGNEIQLPVADGTGNLTVLDPNGTPLTIEPTAPPPDGVFLVTDADGSQIIITFSLAD